MLLMKGLMLHTTKESLQQAHVTVKKNAKTPWEKLLKWRSKYLFYITSANEEKLKKPNLT